MKKCPKNYDIQILSRCRLWALLSSLRIEFFLIPSCFKMSIYCTNKSQITERDRTPLSFPHRGDEFTITLSEGQFTSSILFLGHFRQRPHREIVLTPTESVIIVHSHAVVIMLKHHLLSLTAV